MEYYQISSKTLLPVITREKNNSGANFTIKSKVTGKEYTFQINRSLFKGNWYTFVKVEINYLDFLYLGMYKNGKVILKGQEVESPSAKAIAYILRKVENQQFDLLDSQIELLHTGHCLVCGRELTDSDSIKAGMGPVCRGEE